MKGYIFKRSVETILNKIASTSKLKVKVIMWANIPTASVNSAGVVSLADVRDDANLSQAFLDRYVGFVVHELCHVKYTNFKANSEDQYLNQLHNAVEDIWIERQAIKQSLTGNVANVFKRIIDQMVAESLDNVQDWSDPRQYPFALAVHGRRYANKVPLAEGLEPIFDKASDLIDKANDSFDTLAIAKWVYDQLNSIEGNQSKQGKPESKPEGKPEQGQGQGQGQGEQGEGQSEGQGQGEGQGQEGGSKPSNQAQSDQNAEGKGTGKARKPEGQAVEVEPTCKVEQGDAGIGSYSKDSDIKDSTYHLENSPRYDVEVNVNAKLRYQVRRLFENTGLDEWQHNRKVGAINTSKLASIATGNVHVFKRHHEDGGIDSAVVIVLDLSGSMRRGLDRATVKTCVALYDTLANAGVAVQVIGFNHYTSVLVPFKTPIVKAKQILSRVQFELSTNDYFAIRFAHETLHNRPEVRKVCFVLTDGIGSTDWVKAQITQGDACGITTVGVGLRIDLSDIYKNNIHVSDVDNLGTASFDKIKLVA
jgi:cobalamin biosynthesis protein CobT